MQTLETWLAWIKREKSDDTEQAQHFWSHVAPAAADALLSRDDLADMWELGATLDSGRGLPVHVVETLLVPFVEKAIAQLACFERWDVDDILGNLAALLDPHADLYRSAGQKETNAALAAYARAVETLRRLEDVGHHRRGSGVAAADGAPPDEEAWREAIRVGDRLEIEQNSAWISVNALILSPTRTEVKVQHTESGQTQWVSCDAAELRIPSAAASDAAAVRGAAGDASADGATEEEEDEVKKDGASATTATALARAAVGRVNAWRDGITAGMWVDAQEATTRQWSQAVVLMLRERGPGEQSVASDTWELTAESAGGAETDAATPPRVREIYVHLVGWHTSKREWHDVSSRCIAPLNSHSKGESYMLCTADKFCESCSHFDSLPRTHL